MENSTLARQRRKTIMHNKAKRYRISDIGSDSSQIRSCSINQPTDSSTQSLTEHGSSSRTCNEDIPSKLATKSIRFK
jgi:hypothetical protein